jgi:hypothetical protein
MKENNGSDKQLNNNEAHENILKILSLSSEQRTEMLQRTTELVERWSVSPESLTPDEHSRIKELLRLFPFK